jgi:hypothetical protein
MWLKGISLFALFVFFSVFVYAEESDTTSYIDQALQELNNIEQNQIALKLLLTERENTIAEKELLLNQMTIQFQNLNASYLLSENVNRISRGIIFTFSVVIVGETVFILGDRVFNWW